MADTGFDNQTVGKVRGLTRENYSRWRDEMEDILWSHDLWGHASGGVKAPVVPAEGDGGREAALKQYSEWQVKDSKARALIKRTLDDQTFSHVQDCKSSAEILDRIKTLRDPRTTDALMTEVTAFFEDKWRDGDDVSSYMARVCSLATRVNSMEDEDVKLTDKILMGKVLGCLPAAFMAFKSGWYLMSEKKPSMELFKEKLLTYERGLRGHESRAEHDVTRDAFEDALRVGEKGKNKPAGQRRFPGKCHKCGKTGHKRAQCMEQDQDEGSGKGFAGFVQDCALTVTSHPNPGLILCDSGASRHMSGQRGWFKSLVPLEVPISVMTAVDTITATHVGDVGVMVTKDGTHWTSSVWRDVLFVPGLKFNLFSTGYMARHEGCCFMHEGRTAWIMREREVVVRASLRNGSLIMDMRVTARGIDKPLVQKDLHGKVSDVLLCKLQDATAIREKTMVSLPVEKETTTGRVTGRGSTPDTVPNRRKVEERNGITMHESHDNGHDSCVDRHDGSRVRKRKARAGTGSLVSPDLEVKAEDQRVHHQDDQADGSCRGTEEVVDSLTPSLTGGSENKSILKRIELLHGSPDRVMEAVTGIYSGQSWSDCCCCSKFSHPAVSQNGKSGQ